MKLVMTLLVRDEADIVDAQIAFHLDAGVDFVVATDNRSEDGTTDVLERYAREGHLHLVREPGEDLRQSEWVTRMARLAATDFGADWVLNTDADEFWLPRGGDFRSLFAAVPARYGVVRGAWRNFVPRPDDDRFFAERMTARLCRPSFHPAPAEHPLQVRASCRAGRSRRPREPRGVRSGARSPARLVSDRDPPLPRALARALHAQVRHAVRRARAERGEGHPRPHGRRVRGLPGGRARGLLRAARRRRRRARAGCPNRRARDRHAPARSTGGARLRSGCRRVGAARWTSFGAVASFAGETSALQEADLGLAYATRVDRLERRLARLPRLGGRTS